MKILKSIYCDILNCCDVPPETGGILGEKDGIISHFIFDKGLGSTEYAIYIPNTIQLNEQINKWRYDGINFCGIVHSHMSEQPTLSSTDKEYIELILHSLSHFTKQLYFPIVLPGERIISYKATYHNDVIHICEDKIKII